MCMKMSKGFVILQKASTKMSRAIDGAESTAKSRSRLPLGAGLRRMALRDRRGASSTIL